LTPTKDIAREERLLDYPNPIRPSSTNAASWQEMDVTPIFKYVIDAFFMFRNYLKGKPRTHVREKHNHPKLKLIK
jgi:hypothetical protein